MALFRLLSLMGLLSLSLSSLIWAQTPGDEWVIHYFKEPRPLTLDPTRIAVLGDAGATPDLEAHGLSSVVSQSLGIEGWQLIDTPSAERSSTGVRGLVESMADDESVDFVSPVFIDDLGGPLIVTPTLLVGFAEGVTHEQAEAILAQEGAGKVLEHDYAAMPGVCRVASGTRSGAVTLNIANALAVRPEVRYAEPDMIVSGQGHLMPNDTGFSNCWGLHNTGQSGGVVDMDMDAPEAWDITTGDQNTLVLVIDVGVEQDHPDIHQVAGNDFTSDASTTGGPVNQYDNHGTPVAGCVSATINNSLGTVGSAPSCRVAAARCFIGTSSSGSWTTFWSWTVDALAWAETQGIRVTCNSNGYGGTPSVVTDKYAQTRAAGMIHFASAGNDSSTTITYPSSLPTVNSIAAMDRDGGISSFSNHSAGIFVAGPGRDVYTTDRTGSDGWTGGDYTFAWGTSFATPYTAGIAALMVSAAPTLTSDEIETILRETAVDQGAPGFDEYFGWGLVNAHQALVRTTEPAGPTGLTMGQIVDALLGVIPVTPLSAFNVNGDDRFDAADAVHNANWIRDNP